MGARQQPRRSTGSRAGTGRAVSSSLAPWGVTDAAEKLRLAPCGKRGSAPPPAACAAGQSSSGPKTPASARGVWPFAALCAARRTSNASRSASRPARPRAASRGRALRAARCDGGVRAMRLGRPRRLSARYGRRTGCTRSRPLRLLCRARLAAQQQCARRPGQHARAAACARSGRVTPVIRTRCGAPRCSAGSESRTSGITEAPPPPRAARCAARASCRKTSGDTRRPARSCRPRSTAPASAREASCERVPAASRRRGSM